MADYNRMTVNELRDECRRNGIAAYSKAKRADLIYALQNRLDRVPGSTSNTSANTSRDRDTYANYNNVGSSRDRYNYNRVGQGRMNNGLQSMTVNQLRSMARDLGVSGYSTERKEEIIPKIERAQGMVGSSRDRYNYNRVGQAQSRDSGNIRNLTVDRLRSMAKEMQIPGYSTNTKQELIEKIQRGRGSMGSSRDMYNRY